MKYVKLLASGLMAAVILTACGGSSGSGSGSGDSGGSSGSGSTPTAAAVLSLFAGDVSGPGNLDGTGSAAGFNNPGGIATDASGNMYVTDGSHTIRKITAAGVVTTLAGTAGITGTADGTGAAARFAFPRAVAVDASGNLYVADHSTTIRKVTPEGVVTTLAGTAEVQGSADGTGAAASFNSPEGVAVDTAGNVYVADVGNHTIRKITAAGVVTTLAGTAGTFGITDGTGAAARFKYPSGLTVDATGNVYVTEVGNHTIRKITAAGVVTTLAGAALISGSTDGTGSAARFTYPNAIALDTSGNMYVTEGVHTLRKITPAGVVTTLAGTAGLTGNTDGTGAAARFNSPSGVTVDATGNVYVVDRYNSSIRKVTAAGEVTTLAGTVAVTGSTDGTGTAARFNYTASVDVDASGNVYVADANNGTIRKITAAGVVTTLAGTAGVWGSADGTGAAASFNAPSGVVVDASGNVYVADQGNNTIRKITAAGVVTTLAGTAGVVGFADGTGAAASFDGPSGLAVDASGNVYVADTNNSIIRKITAAGVVTTLAGTAQFTGAAAVFNYPMSLAVDASGNVYVADTDNKTIRKITAAGVVTTLAGTALTAGSTDGTGTAALFNWPSDVALDASGNVYVSDANTIRKITPAGVVTTVVGKAGSIGFVPGALPGVIGYTNGLAISGSTLYFTNNNGIAKVTNLP